MNALFVRRRDLQYLYIYPSLQVSKFQMLLGLVRQLSTELLLDYNLFGLLVHGPIWGEERIPVTGYDTGPGGYKPTIPPALLPAGECTLIIIGFLECTFIERDTVFIKVFLFTFELGYVNVKNYICHVLHSYDIHILDQFLYLLYGSKSINRHKKTDEKQ